MDATLPTDQQEWVGCTVSEAHEDNTISVSSGELPFIFYVPHSRRRTKATTDLVRHPLTDSPLHAAVKLGDVSGVSDELAEGCDPNLRGAGMCTPLHLAAKRGQLETVRVLLEAQADINLRTARVSTGRECYGDGAQVVASGHETALHLALASGHSEVISELLQHPNINLFVCDARGPALTAAARRDNVDAIKAIAKHPEYAQMLAVAGSERGRCYPNPLIT